MGTSRTSTSTRWAAVVLAGGRGSRLGGRDKSALVVPPGSGGPTLLERALCATAAADVTVVVRRPTTTSRPVGFVLEEPPGGGPAAGLLAALDTVASQVDLVVVLAVDMPWVDASTIERLRAAVVAGPSDVDGAVLHDGRRQPLAGCYRCDALLAAAPAPQARAGLSMRALLAGLRLAEVVALGREAHDVDLPEDLAPPGPP